MDLLISGTTRQVLEDRLVGLVVGVFTMSELLPVMVRTFSASCSIVIRGRFRY